MPKIKKKAAKKKPAKAERGNPISESIAGAVEAFRDFFGRFTIVAAAGITAVGLIGLALLWSGGYVGMFGEHLNRFAGERAAAAGLDVRRITMKGVDQTSEEELSSAIGPVMGSSLLHFDPYTARARVEELGWVRSAAVSRLYPNTVHVSVREREPAAVWQLSGALHLIDQTGAVIRQINAYEYSNLPLIVGAGAPGSASEILQALRTESALWGMASALIRVGDRRWNLRLKSGADVKFPEHGVQRAVSDLAKFQKVYGILDKSLDYVDLRDINHLVYREKDASETELLTQ